MQSLQEGFTKSLLLKGLCKAPSTEGLCEVPLAKYPVSVGKKTKCVYVWMYVYTTPRGFVKPLSQRASWRPSYKGLAKSYAKPPRGLHKPSSTRRVLQSPFYRGASWSPCSEAPPISVGKKNWNVHMCVCICTKPLGASRSLLSRGLCKAHMQSLLSIGPRMHIHRHISVFLATDT